MKKIYSEIEIRASAEKVWNILTDFNSFPQWNPFIREAHGKIELNGKLKIILESSDSSRMTFHPRIIKLEPNRELCWLGRFFIPGLFDGEHIFIIEPIKPNYVNFTQLEKFKGVLVPKFSKKLDSSTKQSFIEMNNNHKKLGEQK